MGARRYAHENRALRQSLLDLHAGRATAANSGSAARAAQGDFTEGLLWCGHQAMEVCHPHICRVTRAIPCMRHRVSRRRRRRCAEQDPHSTGACVCHGRRWLDTQVMYKMEEKLLVLSANFQTQAVRPRQLCRMG